MSDSAQLQHRGLIGDSGVPPETEAKAKAIRRDAGFPVGWLIAPSAIWLLLFLVIPLLSIVVFTFWSSEIGKLDTSFTLENYAAFFYNEGFFDSQADRFLSVSVFLKTLWNTFRFTLEVMALCLLVGYPIAYFLALRIQTFKWQMALFLICMVPFWTSYLIRAVAWIPMLGRRGLLNKLLLNMGIVDQPVDFLLYSEFAYTMALVQLYVVLSVGPIFFSLAKIDKTIIEAARDMGAKTYQIFWEIILPLSLPGVAIGMVFIFVMIMGEFATAVVVYGGKTSTVGTVILNYYAVADYPFAAVNAIMLMLAMMIGVVIILRLIDIRKEL